MQSISLNLLDYQAKLIVKTDDSSQKLIKCLVRQKYFPMKPFNALKSILLCFPAAPEPFPNNIRKQINSDSGEKTAAVTVPTAFGDMVNTSLHA